MSVVVDDDDDALFPDDGSSAARLVAHRVVVVKCLLGCVYLSIEVSVRVLGWDTRNWFRLVPTKDSLFDVDAIGSNPNPPTPKLKYVFHV